MLSGTLHALHCIWLIATREYLERVRTRAFAIMTVMIPCLMGGLVFGGGYLSSRTKANAHIAIVSSDAGFAADLKHELETTEPADKSTPPAAGGEVTASILSPSAETRAQLNAALADHNDPLAGYLWITPAAEAGGRPSFTWLPRSAGNESLERALKSAIKVTLVKERLTHQGASGSEIESLLAPVDIDTSATGSSRTALGAAYLLFFLMYMVIMLYGMNTARSIIEEKSSRIFEVMLSTIQPEQMLAGKILGVGAVGLSQVAIWMAVAGALAATPFAASLAGGPGHLIFHPVQLVFFAAYFVFGFMLYSSIAAALGAMTNSEQELQQLNMFLVLPLACCMLLQFAMVNAPDSALSRTAALIPFFSPLLMNFRISLGNPQPWELALSFVLMSVTILAILYVASRIYRVGILMYGKKPDLTEILRWLKYS